MESSIGAILSRKIINQQQTIRILPREATHNRHPIAPKIP